MALAHFPGAQPRHRPTHAYGPIDASAADGRQRINTLSALALDGDISGSDEFTGPGDGISQGVETYPKSR